MVSLAYAAVVADQRRPGRERLAGILDEERIVVASREAGGAQADTEFSFALSDALALAEACLAGEPRALTAPGLARKLSATVAVLFRVATVAGVLKQADGTNDGGADGWAGADDRDDAGGAGDFGD